MLTNFLRAIQQAVWLGITLATFLSFRAKSRNLLLQIDGNFSSSEPWTATHLSFLFVAVGIIAFLYSSVGHAGASGYIAVMALWGLAATTIRPTALILNILVATIGSFQFWKAGHFSWKLFWPFALLSIPAAYLGGYLQLPAAILKILIGLVLIFSAVRLIFRRADPATTNPPTLPVALGTGGTIGFLSGLTGTGGGIFLTPASALFSMGEDSPGCSCFRFVYIGQFDFRFGGILQCPSHHSVAWVRAGTGRYRLWRPRIISRQPSLSRAHHFSPARDCSHHRRIEIDFYEMISGRSCSFGARRGRPWIFFVIRLQDFVHVVFE